LRTFLSAPWFDEALPTVECWDLLAYTNLGKPKYHRIDLPYALEDASLLTQAEMESRWQVAMDLWIWCQWPSGQARRWHEAELLGLAEQLAGVTGPYQCPAGY